MKLLLSNGYITIIDKEDYEKINQFTWWFDGRYAVTEKRIGLRKYNKKIKFYLHRFILNLEKADKRIIDHIDRNKLNNKKKNLRVCTQVENQQNRKKLRNNKSGITGVIWFKPAKMWMATGIYKGKRVLCSYYHDFEEAVKSRKGFEEKYYTIQI